ncbi:MAG: hypothetical protein IPN63_09250 [Gammaproteobacteria bacterium]|nr:hypothetical protein [Gammaproteobacteria bacterium]MBK8132140.1 hypothetical protein [Gammaproteobacteria bacterium]MBK9427556.1 hypothetical protein [Gammaproteobacteria bacterium]
MRRWLILFLLSLLPLQVSWAAAATVDYCAHGQDQTAQHFGHHEDANAHDHDAHAPEADKSHGDAGHTGQLHLDHEHNHLSGFLGLLSAVDVSARKSPQLFPRGDALIYLSLPPGNLERPNWRHLV